MSWRQKPKLDNAREKCVKTKPNIVATTEGSLFSYIGETLWQVGTCVKEHLENSK